MDILVEVIFSVIRSSQQDTIVWAKCRVLSTLNIQPEDIFPQVSIVVAEVFLRRGHYFFSFFNISRNSQFDTTSPSENCFALRRREVKCCLNVTISIGQI